MSTLDMINRFVPGGSLGKDIDHSTTTDQTTIRSRLESEKKGDAYFVNYFQLLLLPYLIS